MKIENFKRINILVGENGSGKTALLEAMFLAGGVSPEIAVRTRNWRGVGGDVHGTPDDINYALWGDLFHRFQTNKPAYISLRGTGDETRSVTVTLNKRGHKTIVPPPRNKPGAPVRLLDDPAPLEFKWKVQSYPDVSVFPIFKDGKLSFSEVSHRYVKASFFAANQTTSSLEVANRFSHLSKAFED